MVGHRCRRSRLFLLLILVLACWPPDLAAEEQPDVDEISHVPAETRAQHRLGLGFYSDFYSQYVWRGLPASNGFVWQPSATVEYAGFGFNGWANFPVAPQPNQGEFNEVDLSPYYNKQIEKFTLVTWLDLAFYPNGNPKSLDTGQTSLEWGLHVERPVGPIFLFTDIVAGIVFARGAVFWNMGLGYKKNLPWDFAVQTSALFALANGTFTAAYVAPVGTVPYQVEWALAFPWTPLNGWTFTPKMSVSTLLTEGLRAASPDPTIIWGGLSVAFSWGELR